MNFYDIAYDNVGVYPQSFNGVPRTIEQDGWNACGSAMIGPSVDGDKNKIEEIINNPDPNKPQEWQRGWKKYGQKLLELVGILEEWYQNNKEKVDKLFKEGGEILILFNENVPTLCYNSSDIFAWGYSDVEEITDDMIDDISHVLNQPYGLIKYHCRKYNQQPQSAWVKILKDNNEWDLGDLPENEYDKYCRKKYGTGTKTT